MSFEQELTLKDARITHLGVEPHGDGSLRLRVRGFAFHSSLAVRDTRVSQSGGAPLVMVTLVPLAGGRDGNFDVSVPLAAADQQVLFGPNQEQIWPPANPAPH